MDFSSVKYTALVHQISNNVYYIPFLSKGPNTAYSKVYFCRFLEMPVGTLCVGMFIYIVAHEWRIHALGYIGIHARRAILMHFHAKTKKMENAQSLPLSGDEVKMKYSSSNQIPSRMDVTSECLSLCLFSFSFPLSLSLSSAFSLPASTPRVISRKNIFTLMCAIFVCIRIGTCCVCVAFLWGCMKAVRYIYAYAWVSALRKCVFLCATIVQVLCCK